MAPPARLDFPLREKSSVPPCSRNHEQALDFYSLRRPVELRSVWPRTKPNKNKNKNPLGSIFILVAPPARLELATSKLTASCSTIELQGNIPSTEVIITTVYIYYSIFFENVVKLVIDFLFFTQNSRKETNGRKNNTNCWLYYRR